MKDDNRIVPIYIAKLITEYFSDDLLTEEERDDLDEWVNASDDNMMIFEEMTDLVYSRKENFWKYPESDNKKMDRLIDEEKRSDEAEQN